MQKRTFNPIVYKLYNMYMYEAEPLVSNHLYPKSIFEQVRKHIKCLVSFSSSKGDLRNAIGKKLA